MDIVAKKIQDTSITMGLKLNKERNKTEVLLQPRKKRKEALQQKTTSIPQGREKAWIADSWWHLTKNY
eukprot:1360551-Prorocentrum_lima.AAC.1